MDFLENTAVSPPSTSRYRVLTELGSGGMANVYLAVSLGPAGFSKLVVLKALKGEHASTAPVRDGFLREARICARMNHPNVVAVHDVELFDDIPVLVMEYLQGQALSSIVRRAGGNAPLPILLHIFLNALSGLHYAHELTDFDGTKLRLVHCDFTPQNIFVTYDGTVKVLDFGVARVTRETGHRIIDSIQGKLRYMAPEQASGGQVDRGVDVFAAGVLLSELISGRRFWGDLSDTAVARMLRSGKFTLRGALVSVPAALQRICSKALAPERQHRYATIAEMQLELEQFLHSTWPEPVTPSEVAAFVSGAFANERDREQRLIAANLANDNYVSWSRIATAIATQTQTLSRTTANATLTIRDSGTAVTRISAVEPTRFGRITFTALTALAAALSLWGVSSRLQDAAKSRAATVTSYAATATTVAVPRPMKPAPTTVDLRVAASPATATIVIDDVAFTDNPLAIVVGVDTAWHNLRIEAPDYVPVTQRIELKQDLDLHFALEKSRSLGSESLHAAHQPRVSRATAVKSHTPPPACSPPFSYDARGVKRFKPECL